MILCWTGEPHSQLYKLPLLLEDPQRRGPRGGLQKPKHSMMWHLLQVNWPSFKIHGFRFRIGNSKENIFDYR